MEVHILYVKYLKIINPAEKLLNRFYLDTYNFVTSWPPSEALDPATVWE